MTRSRGRWLGFVLIGLGVIFLLDSTGALEFGDIVRTYWPLLLVLWGLWVLTRGRRSAAPGQPAGPPPGILADASATSAGESLQSSNVFGDLEVRVTSPSFRGGTVSTVFGDVVVDLSPGGLAEGDHHLTVSGVFGDARLIAPRGAALEVTAHTLAGDLSVLDQTREGFSVSLQYKTPGFETATKRLHVAISQVFGDIRVSA